MNSVNPLIEAQKYLASITESEASRVPDEIGKMRLTVDELERAEKQPGTLSEHRRELLERRIDELFTDISLKLHPVVLIPSEIHKEQVTGLSKLKANVFSMRPKEFHHELKKLPSDVRKKVYEIVWIASGYPNELQFSERLLKKDTSILQKNFPSLLGCKEGTLLDQVEADLELDYQLTEVRKKINGLQEVAEDLQSGKPGEEILRKFQALPQELQDAIFAIAASVSHFGTAEDAKNAILADATELHGIQIADGTPGHNIIKQFISLSHSELTQLAEGKVQFFEDKRNDIDGAPVKLRPLFNFMHTEVQNQLLAKGIQPPFYGRSLDTKLYQTLGAHYNSGSGLTTFRVYAPNASQIVLNMTAFGDIKHSLPMSKGDNGIWVVESDNAPPGQSYHFMITGKNGGEPVRKVDPFSFQVVMHNPHITRDNQESLVYDIDKDYTWNDGAWMSNRETRDSAKQPLAIYEVHAPTWMLDDQGQALKWRDLAPKLADYCKTNNYNAVELMAMFSHTMPESMGYQISNFFAPNCEMGTWEDFQYFVDYMHNVDLGSGRKGINVFADWVPAHFALDQFALDNFDGTSLFEDSNPMYAFHPEWGTKIFDYKKPFIRNFLASNADFILRNLHIDGLRVDAVSSMLYLNYGREQQISKGKIPYTKRFNAKGGEADFDAKKLLRHLNAYVHKQFPGVLTMAEESSAFSNVTRPPYERGEHAKSLGLGFDLTWHFGVMNDTLNYWKGNADQRRHSFSMLTSTVERVDGDSDTRPRGKVIIPYSHDECAAGKGTIFAKMAGNNRSEKFANGRLALAYQLLRGGGPTLDFMGNEILQTKEWHGILVNNLKNPHTPPQATFQWEELDPSRDPFEHGYHRGAQLSRADLNRLFLESPALWDQTNHGLSWIRADDTTNCVLSLHRRSEDGNQQFACIFNTSDNDISDYLIPLPDANYAPELDRLTGIREVYNTDKSEYGGQGRLNDTVEIIRDSTSGRPTHFKLRLPPYTAIVLEEKLS